MGTRGIWENSTPFTQFFCKHKTVLEKYSLLEKEKIKPIEDCFAQLDTNKLKILNEMKCLGKYNLSQVIIPKLY